MCISGRCVNIMIDRTKIANLGMLISGSMDAYYTQSNIVKHGLEIEANPIIRNLMENYGSWETLFFSKLAVGGLCYLISKEVKSPMLPAVASVAWGMGAVANMVVYYGGV